MLFKYVWVTHSRSAQLCFDQLQQVLPTWKLYPLMRKVCIINTYNIVKEYLSRLFFTYKIIIYQLL